MANPFDLTGRVALVTGGGRGIGAAIVTRFAEAGASVVIANRTLDVAEALAAELSAHGLSARAVALAGLDRTALHALVGDVARKSGRLDIVVHNAGGCPWAAIEELDEDKLEEALAVNLKACFWLAQAALPAMRANGYGRILVTSSVSARVAMAGGAHYSAAKAGVNAFIRGAAFEFARHGVKAKLRNRIDAQRRDATLGQGGKRPLVTQPAAQESVAVVERHEQRRPDRSRRRAYRRRIALALYCAWHAA